MLVKDTHGMVSAIAKKERRQAASYTHGISLATWVYAKSKGLENISPEDFNPFLESSEESRSGKAPVKGRKLKWMSKETARGLVEAAENKLLPVRFWIKISAHWYDILATADLEADERR